MAVPIKVVHKEVAIVYNEILDRWEFMLHGRERWAATLGSARSAIDAPPPKKPFESKKAWLRDGRDGKYQQVTVTAIAEKRYCTIDEVWVKDKRPGRRKVSVEDLHEDTTANLNRRKQIKALSSKIDKLSRERQKLMKSLSKFVMPKIEEETLSQEQ